jgi:AAHS family 4-hydroxybenzoate transporter-like MFS transporter
MTNVSDVIDNARFNAYHRLIIGLCGLMVFFDGFDLSAISFAAPDVVKVLGVERAMIAPVFSAGLLGLTLGALGFGFIGDRWGVKRTFILCGVLFGIFSLLTATATSVPVLIAYRFLAGLALGGASPISIAIASDFMPKKLRTSIVMIMYISLAVGGVFAGYSYGYLEAFGWRTVFIVGGLAPIILAPLFIALLPESLVAQVLHGADPARINAILARLEPGGTFTDTTFSVDKENKEGFQPAQLFQDGRAAITTTLWAVFFSSLVALYFFNNWIPILLTGGGLSKHEIVTITTSLQWGGVVGTLLASPIVLKFGGFRSASIGYLIAAAAMLVLSMEKGSFVFLAVATFLVGMFLIGTQSILNASTANVYPPIMRSTGVGWAFGIGRIGSVISPAIAGVLLAMQWQPAQLFMIAAIPTVLASIGLFVLLRFLKTRAPAPAAVEA